MTPSVALTIAGSDSGGGAGIQADLKVFSALGVFGASAVTAVTAQNTRGVTGVHAVPADLVAAQLDAVLDDLPVRAAKTGMLGSAEVARAVAERAAAGRFPALVVDPVLVSTSGHTLGVVDAVRPLLAHATVTTPNVAEASALVGWQVRTVADAERAAAQLGAAGPGWVVVTGGDLADGGDEAVDAVWSPDGGWLLRAPRVATRNTHGTGCSLAAAIAARLALGDAVPDALRFAKEYVGRALAGSQDWQLGGGHGPLDHFGWSS